MRFSYNVEPFICAVLAGRKKRKDYLGNLTRRGETHRWKWSRDGKHYHATFKTKVWDEAMHLARKEVEKIEAEIARKASGAECTVTMKDLLDEFETASLPQMNAGGADAYKDSLGMFRAYFVEECGNPLVRDVKPADVSRFIDWRRTHRRKGRRKQAPSTPVSQRTLRKDHTVLHTLFAWAVENRDYRVDNPCTKKTKPKAGDARQPIVLTDDQLEKLIKECEGSPMLKLFVTLCAETGVRPNSEALWLRWEDVDLERRVLHIVSGRDGHRTKTGPRAGCPSRTRWRRSSMSTRPRSGSAAHRGCSSTWPTGIGPRSSRALAACSTRSKTPRNVPSYRRGCDPTTSGMRG